MRRLRSRLGLHRALGIPLAFLQVVLLAGSSFLHSHHGGAPATANLPAELHHHDYQIAEGGEEGLDFFDGCIGCRMERSREATAPARVENPKGSLVFGIPAQDQSAPRAVHSSGLLPRAPPIDRTA